MKLISSLSLPPEKLLELSELPVVFSAHLENFESRRRCIKDYYRTQLEEAKEEYLLKKIQSTAVESVHHE